MQREIAHIVGTDFIRHVSDADVIDGVLPKFVVEPGTPSDVSRVLAIAHDRGWQVVPRGGGTKLGWGNSPRAADVVLSLCRLDRVQEHAPGDMTATVEAGCTIAALQETLAQRGQRLALDPLWPGRATVGGVLATADSGPLRWSFGPPRDLVLGVTVALADGTLARSGGKVVKNVAGYDLPKLLTGSFGTLGVITQATFRLHPLPAAVRHLTFTLDAASVGAFIAAMRECSLATAAVQIRAGTEMNALAYVRVEGLPEAIEAKAEQVMQRANAAGADVSAAHAPAEDWSARERLFEDLEPTSLVCKIGIPPAESQHLLSLLEREASQDVRWRLVFQAFGVGVLRLELREPERSVVDRLRSRLAEFGGSLVVLACPAGMKPDANVWGEPGDALELMRRIKQQFDPHSILNPGRFLGGI